MPVMTAPALSLTVTQRAELQRMASSTSLPHRQVVQAKGLLWAGQGVANQEIARRCEVSPDAVRRWRARFAEQGVDGVGKIAKGRGRKSPLTEGTVAEIVRVTCQEKPTDGGTHWTTRLLAARFGLGKDTIAKVWAGLSDRLCKGLTSTLSRSCGSGRTSNEGSSGQHVGHCGGGPAKT